MMSLTLALAAMLQVQAPTVPQNAPVPAAEQLGDAESRYRSAIALNPSIPAYHESLALVLERKGALQEALAEHRRAVALDSMSPRNRAGLGSLLLQMGQAKEAAVHLRAATAADSLALPVWMQLARALEADGQHDAAVSALENARTIAPDDSSVALALAQLGGATDPTAGYHDLSGFADDEITHHWIRNAIEKFFAVTLGLAAVVLLGPIAGAVLALIFEMPRQWLARRAA
jgi:tetratricopeptide (TPR) repeat protein